MALSMYTVFHNFHSVENGVRGNRISDTVEAIDTNTLSGIDGIS